MSLPTVTGKVEEPFVMGGHVRRHTKIVFGPTTYVTGGVELLARDLGDTWLLNIPPAISVGAGSHIAYFIFPTSEKTKTVKMFISVAATGAEAANGADLDAVEFVVAVDSVG